MHLGGSFFGKKANLVVPKTVIGQIAGFRSMWLLLSFCIKVDHSPSRCI